MSHQFSPSSVTRVDSYDEAFRSWVASTRLLGEIRHGSSVAVYEHMWSGFSGWCIANRHKIDSLTSRALADFLASRAGDAKLSDRYAWRMLHLVQRIMAHRADTSGRRPNSAAAELLAQRPELQFANSACNDLLPEFLDAGDATRLVTYLCAVRPGRDGDGLGWRELRNRASVGLMLGAGLTPGEVRVMQVNDVTDKVGHRVGVPWMLRVAGNGNAPARETPVAGWAGRLLRWWMSVRLERAIPGSMLFPATSTEGKPWSKMAQFNAARQVLAAAGMDATDGGSFKLRHTFALRQLRRGKSPDDVARWLGVSDPAVMGRYVRVITGPVDLE